MRPEGQSPGKGGPVAGLGRGASFPQGAPKACAFEPTWLGRAGGCSLLESASPNRLSNDEDQGHRDDILGKSQQPASTAAGGKRACSLTQRSGRVGRGAVWGDSREPCPCPLHHRLLESAQPRLQFPASTITCCASSGSSPSLLEPRFLYE